MSSNIDSTVPVLGAPTTASVRTNFATAVTEISGLQAATAAAPFLPLAGGAHMTGPFYLYNDPTDLMMPATKGYVDAHSGGSGGGGIPEAPADTNTYGRHAGTWQPALPIAGGTLTGLLTLSGPPTAALHAATKAYVDSSTITPLKLSAMLLGGAPGGPVASTYYTNAAGSTVLLGNFNAAAVPNEPLPGLQLLGADGLSAGVIIDTFGTGGLPIFAGRVAGGTGAAPTATPINAALSRFSGRGHNGTAYSADTGFLRIAASENWSGTALGTRVDFIATPATTTLAIVVGAFCRGSSSGAGGLSLGGGTDMGLGSCNATAGYYNNGTSIFTNPNLTGAVQIGGTLAISGLTTASGGLNCAAGTLTIGGTVNCGAPGGQVTINGTPYITGLLTAGSITCIGACQVAGLMTVGNILQTSSPSGAFTIAGAPSITGLVIAEAGLNCSGGTLTVGPTINFGGSGGGCTINGSATFTGTTLFNAPLVTYNAILPGGDNSGSVGNPGQAFNQMNAYAFTVASDRRLKRNIGPWSAGRLEAILALQLSTFELVNGKRDGRRHVGLVANDVEAVLPEAVRAERVNGLPLRSLDLMALICALIGAVQELAQQRGATA